MQIIRNGVDGIKVQRWEAITRYRTRISETTGPGLRDYGAALRCGCACENRFASKRWHPSFKQKVVAMSLSSEGDDVFNQQGYLEVEVNAEETGSPTTPAPDGAAADGVSRPERQQQGRRGLMRGTKRDCSRWHIPELYYTSGTSIWLAL